MLKRFFAHLFNYFQESRDYGGPMSPKDFWLYHKIVDNEGGNSNGCNES